MLNGPFIKFSSNKARNVSVAGNFNDWCGSSKGKFDPGIGKMTRQSKGAWVFSLYQFPPGRYEYKFIVDGAWEPGNNRFFFLDEKGNIIDPTGGVESVVMMSPNSLQIQFSPSVSLSQGLDSLQFKVLPGEPLLKIQTPPQKNQKGFTLELHTSNLDITEPLQLEIRGLGEQPIVRPILLDGIFKKGFISKKSLGVSIEGNSVATVFRLFAPRATKVTLRHFKDQNMQFLLNEISGFKDSSGVWEMQIHGLHWGTYYGFLVDGPTDEHEGFQPLKLWSDPYAKANIFHDGLSVLVDPAGFDCQIPWTDNQFKPPSKQDLVIWECSVRDLTSHPTAQVSLTHRGKYLGLIDTIGTKAGIGHMKALGVNAVEFLPLFEFDDTPPGAYHWGYMTSLFFAPEASYATLPTGAQIRELKLLINALHENGISVLFDVVYNHTGSPHNFMGFDKKYFYRHDGNLKMHNFSGCGNDFQSENPMARRLILDSLEYWVREFHVDGFRFDLAELIDSETLSEIESHMLSIRPDLILIAEPWSFRGSIKGQFKGTNWTSWNDDFRNRVKAAALGHLKADDLWPVLKGSTDLWAKHPLESVNYVESHDDYTLIDHLSVSRKHNGSAPSPIDIKRDLFCAAAVLLSPGIPMLAQGQEMLRSKGGNSNSYNAGDLVNALDYSLREKFSHVFNYYRDLIAFRLSPDGSILRNASAETCKAVTRVDSLNQSAIGLLWKAGTDPSKQMLVLFNADSRSSAVFKAPLSQGTWERRVADEKVFRTHDLFTRQIVVTPADNGLVSIEIPALAVELWVPKSKN